MWSARGRARADAQGRGDDGAGSEESIGNTPSATGPAGSRGFCVEKASPFFGEVSEERRPWAKKRESSPGVFCPAFLLPSVDQSSTSEVRVRSISAACHTGTLG